MSLVGIIAEFNPLHNGHKYLISEAKKYGKVAVVISGNFVQRGDTAVYEKRVRAKAALMCGADIAAELPVCYSMSTAQNFALGGVSMLNALGCDTIMFGSECGDIDTLLKTADILKSQKFKELLPQNLQNGVTFAAARQKTAEECGAPKGILEGANNNLAIEYIIAAEEINPHIGFKTVKRQGAEHDSIDFCDEFASAGALREEIKNRNFTNIKNYVPGEAYEIFKQADFSDINRLERAIISALRSKQKDDFKNLPDLSEGVENKIYSAVQISKTLDELYGNIKVKRYTLARVRRLVLYAFLNIDNSQFLKAPPYLRVLGFSKDGEQILRKNTPESPIPIVMRATEIENLGDNAKRMFATENRATDIYALSLNTPFDCGLEYTAKLIKIN